MNPAERFVFIARSDLTREKFQEHPVWVLWEEPEQNDAISAWGVDVDSAWSMRTQTPDGEYYYPYLGEDAVDLTRGTFVAAHVVVGDGLTVHGYLTGGYAFGLFCGGREFIFNVNMPDYGRDEAQRLAACLHLPEHQLFPLTFELEARCSIGGKLVHEKFWNEA